MPDTLLPACRGQVQEQKGLDIVRRDWCPLAKDVGNFALAQILSGRPAEDVILAIHNQLMEVSSRPRLRVGACVQTSTVTVCLLSRSRLVGG